MTSLTKQMENLKKQQAVLADKIIKEDERKKKLNKDSSIERLEALIEPITRFLNVEQGHGINLMTRRNNLEKQRERTDIVAQQLFDKKWYNFFTNEEIFVTLLGIIKKQNVRIANMENNLFLLGQVVPQDVLEALKVARAAQNFPHDGKD